jgi:ADP-ribosylglycohydrolase
MLGAIAGDIIGSAYEGWPTKEYSFDLFQPRYTFTDDTVMTVAVADAIMNHRGYAESMRYWGRRYPTRGYGLKFGMWLTDPRMKAYGSYGNGSAMRVSPVGWAFDTLEEVEAEAKKSAEVSHDHPEGIKGAQAVAVAVFMARKGSSRKEIRQFIAGRYGYADRSKYKFPVDMSVEDIRKDYFRDETCQLTVPPAIAAFAESTDYEDAVRKAVSLGGDSDTLGCITGSIAEAFYKKIPEDIEGEVRKRLDREILGVVERFGEGYC